MKDRLIHVVLATVVFVYIIFEELFWETIARPVYKYIHALKILQKLEFYIHKLPSWVLLVLFLLIFMQVELLGIVAGAMLIKGKVILATTLYLGKIPISAFAFWLFRVSKDKLMTFTWFKTTYDFIMKKIDWIKNTSTYHTIKIKSSHLKATIRAWKRRYFPKGELRRKIRQIYIQIKKIFKRGTS